MRMSRGICGAMMTSDQLHERLEAWRQDISAMQRRHESLIDTKWESYGTTTDEQYALQRAWFAALTAWWEIADVVKSLRAAQCRLPRREAVTAVDVGKES